MHLNANNMCKVNSDQVNGRKWWAYKRTWSRAPPDFAWMVLSKVYALLGWLCGHILCSTRSVCVCDEETSLSCAFRIMGSEIFAHTRASVCVCVAVLLLAGWYCSPPCNLSDISKQSGIIMRIERAWRAYARAFASKSASCRSRCGRGWACRSNWNLLVIIITVSHCECFCRILNTDQARPGNKYVEVIIIHTAECESDKILHKY